MKMEQKQENSDKTQKFDQGSTTEHFKSVMVTKKESAKSPIPSSSQPLLTYTQLIQSKNL